MLGIWTENDKEQDSRAGRPPNLRQIVFINSAAAFLGLPGSIAYTRQFSAVPRQDRKNKLTFVLK